MNSMSNFEYILRTAEKFYFPDLVIKDLQHEIAGRLSKADLAQLAIVYERLARDDDFPKLKQWAYDNRRDDKCKKVLRLFMLFEVLAEMGRAPFYRRHLDFSFQRPPKPLDWSSLPDRFEPFVKLFEKYGTVQTDDQIDEFISNMTVEQETELLELFEGYYPYEEELRAWRQSFDWMKRDEPSLAYFACGLAATVYYMTRDKR
ncbi:MAG TPA: hypothetical protein PLD59_12440 [Tepidisphaeraceae bacterium]|nr:hypothetical protein [Tepidisphaeraceae bacterium]